MNEFDSLRTIEERPDMITSEERHFIRHALGLTRKRVGYRNFFAAGPRRHYP